MQKTRPHILLKKLVDNQLGKEQLEEFLGGIEKNEGKYSEAFEKYFDVLVKKEVLTTSKKPKEGES